MNEEYRPPSTNPSKEPLDTHHPSQNSGVWVTICLVTAAVSVLYRVLVLSYKEQSALLFIGLPLVFAILLSLTPRPQSATGVILKGMTMALLLFGILMFEGLICILMAAPILFLVGAIIGYLADRGRTRRGGKWYNDKMNCACITVIALMSLEGVNDMLSFGREESVVVRRVVTHSPEEAMKEMAEVPDFNIAELPLFLKLGFPTPREVKGGGVAVGDKRVIHFAGGEGEPGDLTLEVTESSSERVVFSLVSDESHIDHWLAWKTIVWEVMTNEEGDTEVVITLNYTRKLDPAWYFKPIERYGVEKAGEYLLETMFDE